MREKLVHEFFGRNLVDGEVGVEIECEGRNFQTVPTHWNVHADGSLRGECAEYVLKKPYPRDKVKLALDYLNNKFRENGTVVNNSHRTSVHVHLNVQKFTFTELTNLVVLYYIYEEFLLDMCGNERKGNLFCLAGTDAEYIFRFIKDVIRGEWRKLATDRIRYSALNLAAVPKYGSVEFRSMRGTTDTKTINDWVDVLLCIRDGSKNFKEPQEIISEISSLGPVEFTRMVFRGHSDKIINNPSFNEYIRSGIWNVQDIAFQFNKGSVPMVAENNKKNPIVLDKAINEEILARILEEPDEDDEAFLVVDDEEEADF